MSKENRLKNKSLFCFQKSPDHDHFKFKNRFLNQLLVFFYLKLWLILIQLLGSFLLWDQAALASQLSYNGGKRPFTQLKANGDYIVGGLSKTLIHMDGSFRALDVMGPITGGFTDHSKIDAIICTEHDIYFFKLNSGKGFEKNEKSFESLLCATNGEKVLIFDGNDLKFIDTSKLSDSSSKEIKKNFLDQVTVPYKKAPATVIGDGISEGILKIIPWKNDFLIIAESGRIFIASSAGVLPLKGSLGSLIETSEIAAVGSEVYLLDENGFYRFSIGSDTAADTSAGTVGDKRRIPINPCSDGERCGISVAQDGSYVVAGYWGIWQGESQSLKPNRINDIPNLSREGGRSSISHTSLGGKYLYLADDDLDLGLLPPLTTREFVNRSSYQKRSESKSVKECSQPTLLDSTPTAKNHKAHSFCKVEEKISERDSRKVTPQSPNQALRKDPKLLSSNQDNLGLSPAKRRVVWLKKKISNSFFSWTTPQGKQASVIYLQPYQELPNDWVAAEDEETISTPLESIYTQKSIPSLEREFWWRSRLELDETMLDLKDLPYRKVKVGVIDTGIAFEHPSFTGQIARNLSEIPLNGLDDDGNGLVDDVEGWDFVHDDSLPEDEHGHGTHVSGLIAGKFKNGLLPIHEYLGTDGHTDFSAQSNNNLTNSSLGVAADHVELIIAKGLGVHGSSNSLDLARAVVYAVDRGAEVINCSWGGGFATQVIKDALSYAVSKGVIVMMSAGNSGSNNDKVDEFPKKLPGLTVVASSDENNKKPKHSNYGKSSVTWACPGDQILSTTKDGQYGLMSGTSMANAISTGVTALALSYTPISAREVRRQNFLHGKNLISSLCESADKNGWVDKTQCGHINIRKYFRSLPDRNP